MVEASCEFARSPVCSTLAGALAAGLRALPPRAIDNGQLAKIGVGGFVRVRWAALQQLLCVAFGLVWNEAAKVAACLVVVCSGLAIAVSAAGVLALPRHALVPGVLRFALFTSQRATGAQKVLVLAVQLIVSLNGHKFGGELFEFAAALWDDHADRLIDFESHRHEFTGEFRIHAET